ncbi:MAG: Jag N-terminal domain-containing protein [Anaerolineaceae bacterium]|nr:Jag N-terminal domain-containing protein [Anaerolineaceae bacterium]
MNKQKTTLEIAAPSIDEAVEKGLDQLGLPRNAVSVEVLDEGKSGFLGVGNRNVRVRLSITDETSEKEKTENSIPVKIENEVFDDPLEEAKVKGDRIVQNLLHDMKVTANVSSRIIDPEDENDRAMVLIEITGKDLSILIGRRAETLNSLQYITSLILNQEMGNWVPLMIDVQGYRFRRERQLRQMARRMADQVVQTGRRQVLEPMPANERRLVHLELRYHPFVTTESVGEEPNRKTTIFLKPKE